MGTSYRAVKRVSAAVNVRVVIIIAALLMFGCCGGVLYSGWSLMQSAIDLKSQAEPIADRALAEMGQNWDPATMKRWAVPGVRVDDGSFEKLSALYRSKYGPLKSHLPFMFSNFKVQSTTQEGSQVWVQSHCAATFAKLPGEVAITLRKKDGQWLVFSFRID
jgi:hypothetical protein